MFNLTTKKKLLAALTILGMSNVANSTLAFLTIGEYLTPRPFMPVEKGGYGTYDFRINVEKYKDDRDFIRKALPDGTPTFVIRIFVKDYNTELTNGDVSLISGTALEYLEPSIDKATGIVTFTPKKDIPVDTTGYTLRVKVPITVTGNSTPDARATGVAIESISVDDVAEVFVAGPRFQVTSTYDIGDEDRSEFKLFDDKASVEAGGSDVTIDVIGNDNFTTPNETYPMNIPAAGTFEIKTAPTKGTVVIDDNGTPNDIRDDFVVYTPGPYAGTDVFTYEVCTAGKLFCKEAEVIVDVSGTPLPKSPVLTPDTATTNEATPVDIPVLGNDSDIPTDGTITVTKPANGTVTIDDGGTPANPSDDVITYTPDTGFSGTDIFDYTVCDSANVCSTETVTVTVKGTTKQTPIPKAGPDTATTTQDTPVDIPVLDNDSDVDAKGTITVTAPTNGTIIIDDGGTPGDISDDVIIYMPDTGFTGVDTFKYTLCDSANSCVTTDVTVNITPAPKPGEVKPVPSTSWFALLGLIFSVSFIGRRKKK